MTAPLAVREAVGVAAMLVSLGRAVPPSRWVDDLACITDSQSMEHMF